MIFTSRSYRVAREYRNCFLESVANLRVDIMICLLPMISKKSCSQKIENNSFRCQKLDKTFFDILCCPTITLATATGLQRPELGPSETRIRRKTIFEEKRKNRFQVSKFEAKFCMVEFCLTTTLVSHRHGPRRPRNRSSETRIRQQKLSEKVEKIVFGCVNDRRKWSS